jgi:hypothetical protein
VSGYYGSQSYDGHVTNVCVCKFPIILRHAVFSRPRENYEACPESKDTKVLNTHKILIYKSDTVKELLVYNCI